LITRFSIMFDVTGAAVEAKHHTDPLLARREERLRDEHRRDRQHHEHIQSVSHSSPPPFLPANLTQRRSRGDE
jgi:hypothetical protein